MMRASGASNPAVSAVAAETMAILPGRRAVVDQAPFYRRGTERSVCGF